MFRVVGQPGELIAPHLRRRTEVLERTPRPGHFATELVEVAVGYGGVDAGKGPRPTHAQGLGQGAIVEAALIEPLPPGALDNGEGAELSALIERYEAGLLRKAHALREAVRRGLYEPLRP